MDTYNSFLQLINSLKLNYLKKYDRYMMNEQSLSRQSFSEIPSKIACKIVIYNNNKIH